MARSLGSLTVDLLLKTGSFETDMGRAERIADKKSKGIASSIDKSAAAIGIALAATATAFAYGISKAIDRADELYQVSQKIGVAVGPLSELAAAAKLADVDISSLQTGLVKLSKYTYDAAQGGKESAAEFRKLGIEFKNLDGSLKSSDQILVGLADKFSKMPDGIQKTVLATKFFGKAGADLIPLLNQGSAGLEEFSKKAKALGITLTDEAGAAADKFNDNVELLKMGVDGFFNKVAADLLPSLSSMTDLLVDGATKTGGLSSAAEIASDTIRVFATAGFLVAAGFEVAGRGIGAFLAIVDISIESVSKAASVFASFGDVLKLAASGSPVLAAKTALALIDKAQKINTDNQAKSIGILKEFYSDYESITLNFSDKVTAIWDKVADPAKPKAAAGNFGALTDELAKGSKAAQKLKDDLEKAAAVAITKLDGLINKNTSDSLSGTDKANFEYQENLKVIAQLEADIRKGNLYSVAVEKKLADARAQESLKRLSDIKTIDDELKKSRDAASRPISDAIKGTGDELRILRASANQRQKISEQLRDQYEFEQLKNHAELEGLKQGEEWLKLELEKLNVYKKQVDEIRKIQDIQQLRDGGLFDFLGKTIEDSIKEGAGSFSEIFKKNFKDIFKGTGKDGALTTADGDGIANFIGNVTGELSNLYEIFKSSDGNKLGNTLRAVSTELAKIPGPVGWIAQSLNYFDTLTGGKLFGTSFERQSSSRNLNFTNTGFAGSTSTTDVRQRSFFRGRQFRTRTEGVDAQTQSQMDAFFENVRLSVSSAARELGAKLPDVISGAFTETYDKDGKLTASFSTVMGRKFIETAEEFSKRIQAENILGVISQILPSAEVNKIADGWRENAEALSQGAGLLFSIGSDIDRSLQLWTATGDGTLTRVVEIVEALQQPGEQLVATYQRLTQTARAYGTVVAAAEGELLLAAASDFAKSIILIRQEETARIKALQDQARALGGLQAREQDLARVRAAATMKIEQAAKQLELSLLDTVAELYGTPLSQIEAEIARITGTADNGAKSLRDFLTSLALSQELSPLNDQQKFGLARTQLTDAAGAKDVQGFITAAQSFLEISRRLNASGSDYTNDFNTVNSLAGGFGFGDQQGGDLQALIAQRDALQARQRAAERLGGATTLAQGIADLSDVRGQSFADVAASLGVNLGALATDLGLNTENIGVYLQSLQVDTADLAQILTDLPNRFASALFDVLYGSDLTIDPLTPATETGGGSVITNPPIGGFDERVPNLIQQSNGSLISIVQLLSNLNKTSEATATGVTKMNEQAAADALRAELYAP